MFPNPIASCGFATASLARGTVERDYLIALTCVQQGGGQDFIGLGRFGGKRPVICINFSFDRFCNQFGCVP